MKDQYFGDLNDYRKYGLLRMLADAGSFRIGVCWMLTPPDGRRDGSRLRYLEQPERFRTHDPLLFDALHESVKARQVRCVAEIERAGSADGDTRAPLLPGAAF